MQINAALTITVICITNIRTKFVAHSRAIGKVRIFFQILSHGGSLIHSRALVEALVQTK